MQESKVSERPFKSLQKTQKNKPKRDKERRELVEELNWKETEIEIQIFSIYPCPHQYADGSPLGPSEIESPPTNPYLRGNMIYDREGTADQ